MKYSFYVVNYLDPGKNWQELQKELDAEPEPDDEDRSQKATQPHYLDDIPSDTSAYLLYFILFYFN